MRNNLNKDLAQKEHWDFIYQNAFEAKSWKPQSYDSLCIERMLMNAIKRYKPKSILEVGCGNSYWLPYLNKTTNIAVAGIDYSEIGCEKARENLNRAGASGKIYCADIFQSGPELTGTYDMVFSLGVVEHFFNLNNVLEAIKKFANPGGSIITEVPNLKSVHGLMAYIWHPALLKKHRIISKKELVSAHIESGLENVRASYLGLFSLNIINWEIYHRFRFYKKLLPLTNFLNKFTNRILIKLNLFAPNTALLSPFIYVTALKKDELQLK